MTGNLVLLVAVVAFVVQPSANRSSDSRGALSSQVDETISNPLDELSSADIAVSVAQVTRIEEATSVANKADTVNAQLSIAPTSNVVSAQPQLIASAAKSRFDIQTYIVQEGDTLESLARQFGITSDTIRWSNENIESDQLKPGSSILISPITGIIYTVKSGDTVASLASKYSADKNKITVFNDIEVTGMPVGERIVIPDGSPPSQAIVPAAAPASTFGTNSGFAWGGNKAVYGGNGYDYGYCTWWAAIRRAQIGRPIPSNLGNASTWKALAAQAGFGVGSKPAVGAVMWVPPRDYYGHVGFVEKVNADGSVLISEMNTVGWGVVSKKTLSASEATGYGYIY